MLAILQLHFSIEQDKNMEALLKEM
uniref:Uncharacterized protein n=1 Tax=Anguilla anguilla TaxID=7936 RepID=A0A0E9WIJ4_ANGAN